MITGLSKSTSHVATWNIPSAFYNKSPLVIFSQKALILIGYPDLRIGLSWVLFDIIETWYYLKSEVFTSNPRTIEALKAQIRTESFAIMPDLLEKVMETATKKKKVNFLRYICSHFILYYIILYIYTFSCYIISAEQSEAIKYNFNISTWASMYFIYL